MSLKNYKSNFVLLLLAILIQSNACSNANPPGEAPKAIKSNYLSLLPAETNILIYANFEELKKSPLGNDVKNEFKKKLKEEEDEDYQEFVQKTGLNLEEDIREIWVGGLATEEDKHFGGILVKGDFNEKRITDYMKKKHEGNFIEKTYNGSKIYITEDDDDANITFLNNSLAVIGKEPWLQAVIDQSGNSNESVLNNTVMSKHLNEIEFKNHFWGILNLEELSDDWAKNIKKNSKFNGTESIKNMKSVYFYTNFDTKTDVFIKGNFSTKEEAELIAEMLNGFKAMAKLMVSDDKEAIDLLNDIRIRTKGSVIEITTKVDKNFFDKFKEKRAVFSEGKVKLL